MLHDQLHLKESDHRRCVFTILFLRTRRQLIKHLYENYDRALFKALPAIPNPPESVDASPLP